VSEEGMAARLIVALDVPTRKDAKRVVHTLDGVVEFFKVGLELFTAEGPALIEELTSEGREVFLDLKLHDIPNTVAGAVRSATRLGVRLLTLHTLGGSEMMRSAVGAGAEEADRLGVNPVDLLGVTVLTSQRGGTFIGDRDLGEAVLTLATEARDSGLPGVVASVGECRAIKKTCGARFLVATPGIRPVGAASEDQKRVATPGGAVEAGSNFVVVGRPVLKADDPAGAARSILEEMQAFGPPTESDGCAGDGRSGR